jgi:translation elongation factor EF-4
MRYLLCEQGRETKLSTVAAMRRMEIITPTEFVGTLMELAQQRRGEFVDMTYLTETRTTLVYNLPLAEARRPCPDPPQLLPCAAA